MSVVTITKENYQQEVLESELPVLLDFWASWCNPCRMLSPIIDQIADEHPEIKVGKINVDEEAPLAIQFGVASIPTLIVMEGGQPVAKVVGYRPKADLLKALGL